jgi:penicillin-binding protein 1A
MKRSIRIFWIAFSSIFGVFLLVILLCMIGVFGKLPSLEELENPSIYNPLKCMLLMVR